MVNVDGKHSDRFLAEVRFKNQLSEIAAQSFWWGAGTMQVLQSLRRNTAVVSRAEQGLMLLSSSCFSACFALEF